MVSCSSRRTRTARSPSRRRATTSDTRARSSAAALASWSASLLHRCSRQPRSALRREPSSARSRASASRQGSARRWMTRYHQAPRGSSRSTTTTTPMRSPAHSGTPSARRPHRSTRRRRRSSRRVSKRRRQGSRAETMSSEPNRGYVLVTGTSTGIGAATALHLAEKGFHVFAGVRQAADGEMLRAQAPERLTPLIIDVTDESTISPAAAGVADVVGERGLAGLVNNAGIGVPAPIEFQPMADFRKQLEVNLFGPVAMIQAFLPLIRRGGGRIVNVGSIGGLLVLPLNGAYSASKFGMRAISDALRLELWQWNIHVSLIEVAPVKTAIFGKSFEALDSLESTLREEGFRLYEQQIAAIRKAVEKAAGDADPPLVIAKAILHALTSDKPKTRYLAGHGGRETAAAAALPDRARDSALAHELGLPKPEQPVGAVSRK